MALCILNESQEPREYSSLNIFYVWRSLEVIEIQFDFILRISNNNQACSQKIGRFKLKMKAAPPPTSNVPSPPSLFEHILTGFCRFFQLLYKMLKISFRKKEGPPLGVFDSQEVKRNSSLNALLIESYIRALRILVEEVVQLGFDSSKPVYACMDFEVKSLKFS